PMPFAVIKQQVEKELGQPIDALFAQFDQSPFAAASIGQVHKAVLPTGEAVVVKVQYPDVDTSIDSDLKHVRLALKITGVLNMDKTLQDKIFAEIRDSLYDELDYSKEAHNLAIFGSFHSDDDGLIIPKVFHSHSTRRILTLSQELGEKLEVAATWDNDIKQKI
ncbi:AarF/UbiB family protein, partial [Xanthomonas citri pv. citri]